MKVIVDTKIPYIKGIIERLADEVVYAEGGEFDSRLVRDADALIVRTRTRCDRRLLEGSRVRFIATATIGFDHIDTDYCRRAGITWANAPGCNSGGVEQYVHSALLLLERDRGLRLQEARLGVVGVGHVGSRVARVGRRLGMNVRLCDPPRAEREGDADFCTLEEIARTCDVITFHTPLTHTGAHPTWHLADNAFFSSLPRCPYILNTSRGEVVDNEALLDALKHNRVADAVLDVWENEPKVNRSLLERVFIGTPHIAGYSGDGKANATRMALQAYCRFFGLPEDFRIEPPAPEHPVIHAATEADALLQIYNPLTDSLRLKADPAGFEAQRGDYHYRREADAYTIIII
ncbi:4-phosphoerythronate dehydrogenase PdxB [Phocaeicola coprophilus]|nr:4-phosphoerythronate dehydrogenase PdxB [Phocaeicola coprophilus]